MSKIIICKCCEGEFDASKRNHGKGIQKYCGATCRQVMDTRRKQKRREAQPKFEPILNKCVICEQSFETDNHHPGSLTCSIKCNEARMNTKRRIKTVKKYDEIGKKECEECGSPYWPNKYSMSRAKYCSTHCASKATSRAYNSRNKRYSDKRLKTSEWKKAKKAALDRDGHKCCLCGVDKRLHVHHVLNLTKEDQNNHSLGNLITFCNSCHSKMHTVRISKENGEYVISGAIFDYLKIDIAKVRRVYAEQEL